MFATWLKFGFVSAVSMIAASELCAESTLARVVADSAKANCIVVKIDKSSAADLIVINGGLRDGFRPGVQCLLINPDQSQGEVMIVESSLDKSVALAISQFDVQEGANIRFNVIKKL